ncbi:MAG: BRO family protein, partial [Cetobacterium sp.]
MNLSVIKTETILGMELRVFGDIENPLFLAKEIATNIEYKVSHVSEMLDLVDDAEEKIKIFGDISNTKNFVSPTESRVVEGATTRWYLTEDGVYSVLMKSTVPKAKEFRKGFKNFLKAWRKGEAKVVQEEFKVPTTYKEALLALIEAEEVKEKLLLENKEVKEAVVEIKHSLNNLEADVRININQAIRRL